MTFEDVAGVEEAKEELSGDRRVPQGAAEVPEARRQDPQGRAADGPAGHRQDAARPGHRRRGQRAVLLDLGLRLRRDVRRRRRLAGARPLRAGQEERPLHHLHRRDRRRRAPPRRRPRRRPRRARADAQPAAGRDGRLRDQRRRHPDRRHQPPDVLDPALLRPGRFDRRVVVDRPDVNGRVGILEVHTRNIPLSDDVDSGRAGARHPGLRRRRPGEPGQRGGAPRGAAQQEEGRAWTTSSSPRTRC